MVPGGPKIGKSVATFATEPAVAEATSVAAPRSWPRVRERDWTFISITATF